MKPRKVALIDKELAQIPGWAPGVHADVGIDFAYGNCDDAAQVLARTEGCDILWINGGSRLTSPGNLPRLEECRAVIRLGSGVDCKDVDAAKVDGAADRQVFALIALPLAWPALATVAITSLIATWYDLIWPLVTITSRNWMPLAQGLVQFSSSFETEISS